MVEFLINKVLEICLLIDLVSNYTREAGVRELERKFGALCRAVAVRVAEKEKGSNSTESSTVSIPFLNTFHSLILQLATIMKQMLKKFKD